MKKAKFTQAFTIIELTAVMVIIMIIATMIMGVGRRARIMAMEAKAKTMIAALEVALSIYHVDTAAYPYDDGAAPFGTLRLYDLLTNTEHGDNDGVDDIEGWRGPYMGFKSEDKMGTAPNIQIKDPWGNSYHYTYGSGTQHDALGYDFPDIWSNGVLENPAWWDVGGVRQDLKNW